MEESHPSLARKLSLIATALLATVIAVVLAIVLWTFWERHSEGSKNDFWTHLRSSGLDEVPVIFASFCVGTLLSSPLVLRLGRVSKLWHVALLTATVVGVTVVLLATDRLSFIEGLVDDFLPAGFPYLSSMVALIAFAQVVNTAVGCLLCRAGRRYFRRAKIPDEAVPDGDASGNPVRRFGSRAEAAKLVMILASLLLVVAGIDLAIREILAWQIPPAIWEVLRDPRQMTLVAFQPMPSSSPGRKFHGHKVEREVAVKTDRDRAAVVNCLKRGIGNYRKRDQGTSTSEYGLRATDGTTTFDFLISFQTARISIFEGEILKLEAEIYGSAAELDALAVSIDP